MPSPPAHTRLYGRAAARRCLLDAFEATCVGEGGLIAVPGASGTGKTSLVASIQPDVEAHNGWFLRGKFNQNLRDEPFSAVRVLLTEWARRVRHDDRGQIGRWRGLLLDAIGDLGQLLVDLAPELGAVFGPLPHVVDIAPIEARHRFAGVIRRFLEVISRPEHPVVAFFDDWQWADPASIDLFEHLHTDSPLRYLMFVTAWRDDEVDARHPFLQALEQVRKRGTPVVEVAVGVLGPADLADLIAGRLHHAVEDLGALTGVVHDVTHGNPYFVHSLLELLIDQGHLHKSDGTGRWRWSIDEDARQRLPRDLVDLFRRRLEALDEPTRALLAHAALLGSHFDVATLATVSAAPADRCRALLTPVALDGGLVTPDGLDRYAFRHDRVQQAAFLLTPPRDRLAAHLQIGRRLLQDAREQRLFLTLEHLNVAQELVRDPEEQAQLIALNATAARRAWAATAYQAALRFHRCAAALLAAPGRREALWRRRPDLAGPLHREWAQSEFLEGDRSTGERCVREAIQRAVDPLDAAEAWRVLIVYYTLHARYFEAIHAGREALAALGVHLPETDLEAARDREIARVRAALAADPRGLGRTAPQSDPTGRMIQRLLGALGPPCYRAHQRLWAVLVPQIVYRTLTEGLAPELAYAWPAFGGLVIWVDGDQDTARRFGAEAARVMDVAFPDPAMHSVLRLMVGSSVRHWFGPLADASADYAAAYDAGRRSGNLQYAAYAFGHDMYCRFFQGQPLDALRNESHRSLAFSRTRLNQWAIDLLCGGLRVFDALAGDDPAYARLMQARTYLDEVERHGNSQVVCIYRVLESQGWLFLGEPDRALHASDSAEALLPTAGTQGLLPWPEHVFTRALARCALWGTVDDASRARWAAEIHAARRQIARWAEHNPRVYGFRRDLLDAELAHLDGRADPAALYDRAIDDAAREGFLHWSAYANERAAAYWRGLDPCLERIYAQQAYVAYERWGAAQKTARLEAAHRAWLAGRLPPASVDRQIGQWRGLATAMGEARLRQHVTAQATELAEANERLRYEVAERRRVEDALRQQQEALEHTTAELRRTSAHYQALLHTTTDGIHVLDARGHLVEWNDAFRAHLGHDEAVLHGLHVSEWDRGIDPEQLLPFFEQVTRTGGRFETRHLRADGEIRDVEVNIGRLGHGPAALAVASSRDITDRKRSEAVLQSLHQRAERDARDKADLLVEINHRVKNNLTSILGLLVGERRRARPDVLPALDRIAARVRGLLDAHALLAATEWAPVRVDQLFDRVVRSAVLTADPPPEVLPDASDACVSPRQASALALVFNEIGTNAAKYALGARRVTLTCQDDGDALILDIHDDGPGFPDAVLGGQSNIGLALVRQLVTETLRGDLTFANQGGAWTRLRIRKEETGRT